ncbi:MAG: hypothetical protein OXT70_12630 [Chloroflexota bacterium]|nr:hypothetical protein [Chloroflexota bacterium]
MYGGTGVLDVLDVVVEVVGVWPEKPPEVDVVVLVLVCVRVRLLPHPSFSSIEVVVTVVETVVVTPVKGSKVSETEV